MSQRYAQGVEAYSAAGEAATIAINNDWVSLETAEAIGEIDEAAHSELVTLREALDNENAEAFDWGFDRFRRILRAYQEAVAEPDAEPPDAEDGPDPPSVPRPQLE